MTPPPHVANFLTSPSQLSLISSPSTISPRSSRSSASLDPDEEAIFHQLIREHDGLTKENGILREEVERAEEILATTQRQAIENKILYDQAREQTEIVLLDRDVSFIFSSFFALYILGFSECRRSVLTYTFLYRNLDENYIELVNKLQAPNLFAPCLPRLTVTPWTRWLPKPERIKPR